MSVNTGPSRSFWLEGVTIPYFASANDKMHADVCIVGAGIAGLTTAYLLAREGKSVIVLDEKLIGSGQTSRTSAHLASAIDDRFVEIERLHGEEGSRLAYQSHAAAIDTIERISQEEKIACEFSRLDGLLHSLPSQPDLLDQELAAAKRAGCSQVEKLAKGGWRGEPCLRFGRQGKFHPMLYLVGLAEAIKRLGGQIFTGKRVVDVQGFDSKKKTPPYATLQDELQVTADDLVVATNAPAPINDWLGIYTKQTSYQTYVIGAPIPRGSVPDALYWDTADPYHYIRLEKLNNNNELLLIGGEDHRTGQFPQNSAPFMNLETWARAIFPMMGEVSYRWSGQIQETADGLAFIGRVPTNKEHVFVATGDSGMGLTHGTIAGLLITDLIMGRENPWAQLYDPSRKMLNRKAIRENANTLAQYKDLLTAGEVKSVDEIPAGHGAVLHDGLTKLAMYRDPGGMLHSHSAICPHLQCVVQWNPVEQSWDCPCHGSRFDPQGKVLMGPAIDDLRSTETPKP